MTAKTSVVGLILSSSAYLRSVLGGRPLGSIFISEDFPILLKICRYKFTLGDKSHKVHVNAGLYFSDQKTFNFMLAHCIVWPMGIVWTYLVAVVKLIVLI